MRTYQKREWNADEAKYCEGRALKYLVCEVLFEVQIRESRVCILSPLLPLTKGKNN